MTDITTEQGERVLEGTWEEILAHAAEYAGKRLRVTVLAEQRSASDTAASQTGRSLDDILRPILAKAPQRPEEPPVRHSDPQEAALEDLIAAKRRRGRL